MTTDTALIGLVIVGVLSLIALARLAAKGNPTW